VRLESGKYISAPEFIIYPRPLSVHIAPVKELIWAYLSLIIIDYDQWRSRYQLNHWGHTSSYKLVLSFSTGIRIIARVRNSSIGISELQWLKKQNPGILIGYRQDLQSMYEYDFNGLRERITTDIESIQQGLDAKDIFIDTFFCHVDDT